MSCLSKYRTTDHLAGGSYIPYGVGCLFPGPNGCPPRWNKLQVPYILKSYENETVQTMFQSMSKVMDDVSGILSIVAKKEYICNKSKSSISGNYHFPQSVEGKGWYSNQAIFRAIGDDFNKMQLSDTKIALHCDEHDEDGHQPLVFSTFGGENNLGGHIPGTDLLVFDSISGGQCFQVQTCVEDCLVCVLMNSSKQLHGSANCDAVVDFDSSIWSLRYIQYLGKDTFKYIKAKNFSGEASAPYNKYKS